MPDSRSTDPRTPVTRERALVEAVALADAEGIDAVSMRNLAARLGVVPMALYKHVANKDDLLAGMVDRLIVEYASPEPGSDPTDWKSALRTRILSARRVLLDHPWARRVIESRTTRTAAVLGYMDALAGDFIAGGFGANLTHHVMHVLGHRIWGFSPEAFTATTGASDELDPPAVPVDPHLRQQLLEQMAAAYPNIAAITLGAVDGDWSRVTEGCDEQFEFEFALGLLLDGFERLQADGWTSSTRS